MSNDLIGETREAMAMLTGHPIVEFEPAADVILRDESGEYKRSKSLPWIKLSLAFGDELEKCKGAPLSVFLCICMHVNENGHAWPGIRKICQRTGYSNDAVISAVRKLKDIGLIKVIPRKGRSTIYAPLFAAYGKAEPGVPKTGTAAGVQENRNSGVPKTGTVPFRKTGTKQEERTKEQEGADARALVPPGEGDGKRTRRDALDIQMSFDTLKAQGRAEGRDRSAAAHPMAGRWPHLVDHCRAFEAASGLSAADLTRSQLAKWARDLEGHVQAGLVADDERRLYGMARAEKWKVYSPGSMDSLIATMRKGAATHAVEQPARPLY